MNFLIQEGGAYLRTMPSKISGLGENGVLVVQSICNFWRHLIHHLTFCEQLCGKSMNSEKVVYSACGKEDKGRAGDEYDDLVIFEFTTEEDILAFCLKTRELGLLCLSCHALQSGLCWPWSAGRARVRLRAIIMTHFYFHVYYFYLFYF